MEELLYPIIKAIGTNSPVALVLGALLIWQMVQARKDRKEYSEELAKQRDDYRTDAKERWKQIEGIRGEIADLTRQLSNMATAELLRLVASPLVTTSVKEQAAEELRRRSITE